MEESIQNFAKYLIDNGLLFEINRKVLHPLGLAMIVDRDWNNKKKLAVTALIKTDDKEGFLFDEEGLEIGQTAYNKFLKREGERLDVRKDKYGFIEQDRNV